MSNEQCTIASNPVMELSATEGLPNLVRYIGQRFGQISEEIAEKINILLQDSKDERRAVQFLYGKIEDCKNGRAFLAYLQDMTCFVTSEETDD